MVREKIKDTFQKLWSQAERYPVIYGLSSGALLIVIAAEVLMFLRLGHAKNTMVIHYTRDGIDQFGGVWEILGYGIVVGLLVVINHYIALELEKRDWFWGKFVAGFTFGLAVLLFVAFQAIISVN